MEQHEKNYPLLEILYYHYVSNMPGDTDGEKRSRGEVRLQIRELSFAQQDAILCTVNALCCEYEREAYIAGLRDGARIFRQLLA